MPVIYQTRYDDWCAECPMCSWASFWEFRDEAEANLEQHEYWNHGREGIWTVDLVQ